MRQAVLLRRASWLTAVIFLGSMCFGLSGAAPDARAAGPSTSLSIQGTDFLINGEITYKGRTKVTLDSGGTANLEGLLLNARMINAVFDDDNATTRSNWKYPAGPAEAWNADRHTTEFAAMLPTYREEGLLMVSVGLQGGNPASGLAPGNGGAPSWIVSAFNADGSLKPAWMARLASVIEAADAVGMVVNVMLFYQRQEHRLANEAAAQAAVDRATDWLVDRGYANVMVTIQNEVGSGLWASGIWQKSRAHELIERAKGRHPSLIVGTMMRSEHLPTPEILGAGDFIAFSGNSWSNDEQQQAIDETRAMAAWQASPKPILLIEDGPRPSGAEMEGMLRKGVSFGYHDDGRSGDDWSNYEDGFQWVPANWTINTTPKKAFFDRVARLTAAPLSPPPPADSDHELVVSTSSDRGLPVGLAGTTVSGDVYVFVAPEEGLTTVRFWLDDPDRSEEPVRTETSSPWDFAGGGLHWANAFDTTAVADGTHTITAELSFDGGSVEVVEATFTVGNATAALGFSPGSLSFTVEEGSVPLAQASELTALDGSSASFTTSADSPWVTVSPPSGSTPAGLTVVVDPSGLSPGTYLATVTGTAAGYTRVTLPVTLTVTEASTSPYELLVSSSPDRKEAVELAGRTLNGAAFVFLSPEEGAARVSFFLDDPAMAGAPRHVERFAPYDFAGTQDDGTAAPFDTSTLEEGTHEITAVVERPDGGSELVRAAFTTAGQRSSLAFSPDSLSFTVEQHSAAPAQTARVGASDGSSTAFEASADRAWVAVSPAWEETPATLTVSVDPGGLAPGTYSATVTAIAEGYGSGSLTVALTVTAGEANPSPYELVVSSTSDRASPVRLAGATASGAIYVFVAPGEGVTSARFWLDDPDRTGSPVRTERNAPWDFAGGGVEWARPFETTAVNDGSHTITAELGLEDGGVDVVEATFTVANS